MCIQQINKVSENELKGQNTILRKKRTKVYAYVETKNCKSIKNRKENQIFITKIYFIVDRTKSARGLCGHWIFYRQNSYDI